MQARFIVLVAFLSLTILSLDVVQYTEGRENPCHYPPGSRRDDCSRSGTKPLSAFTPEVIFPTYEEIYAYLKEGGTKTEFSVISNTSLGVASNVETAISGNTTWVAWQSKTAGINRVFLAVSFDAGNNFTQPVQLSKPDAGNASNL